MDSNRQQKVGKLFQEELAEAFRKWASELFPGNLVSVTEVKVTPDLSIAKVFISIFPNDKKDEILQEINTQAPYFRGIYPKELPKTCV